MSNITIVPVLPSIDTEMIAEITTVVDDMLLSTVQATKVATVPAGQARTTARAWSFSGNID